jgi:hypothetical protein
VRRPLRCYRIVEVRNGEFCSLFHGTNGSRVLPVGEWLCAERKVVGDGGARRYLAGFHVFMSLDVAEDFLERRFRRKEGRIIVECEARGLRRKECARGEVYLADWLRVVGRAKPRGAA